jgi:drug/metabolite transporter (DMT)-like permease
MTHAEVLRAARLSTLKPWLALLLSVVCIGLSAIFVKWAAVPGAASGFWRMGFAVLLMLPLFLRDRKQRQITSRRAVLLAMLSGVMFAGDIFFWNTGALMSNVTTPTFLANTAPLWVGLGAYFLFRQTLRAPFWIGLAIALVGAAVLLGRDAVTLTNAGIGGLFGLIAGFFYGSYILLTQRARLGLSVIASFWIATLTCMLSLLALALINRQALFGYSGGSYVNLFLVALVSQVGGYVMLNYALGHLPASVVSPVLLVQPIFTALISWPLLGEPLSTTQIAGCLLVVAGVYVVIRHGR